VPECDWVWSCGGLFSPVLKGLQVACKVLLREIKFERHNNPELFVVTPRSEPDSNGSRFMSLLSSRS